MPRNVAILIFDEVEVLDFCGPFEVFSVTGRRGEGEPPFNVYTIAEKPGAIHARNGLSVNPTYTLENCPQPDILLIPGGYGTRPLLNNAAVLEWIRAQSGRVELLLSVCTGALLLGKIGLLDGLSATTHFMSLDLLKEIAPTVTLCPNERYVDNGKIVLSAGVSAGIDMAFYVVGRLLGAAVAAETARYIQYDYWLQ
ncbi:MAG: DJ-1/PfpI family protein [Anaerolineaceae bacterium]|nr:DJ-1/PfpI family protein [Anaerolineaceae bacterium]